MTHAAPELPPGSHSPSFNGRRRGGRGRLRASGRGGVDVLVLERGQRLSPEGEVAERVRAGEVRGMAPLQQREDVVNHLTEPHVPGRTRTRSPPARDAPTRRARKPGETPGPEAQTLGLTLRRALRNSPRWSPGGRGERPAGPRAGPGRGDGPAPHKGPQRQSSRTRSQQRSTAPLPCGAHACASRERIRPLYLGSAGPWAKDTDWTVSSAMCQLRGLGETDSPPPPAFLLGAWGPALALPGSGPSFQAWT